MTTSITRMTANVQIRHFEHDGEAANYKIVNDTRFTINHKNNATMGMITGLTPEIIQKGQSGSGQLTVLSPERLGEEFLSSGVINIEVLGVVIAECQFENYQIKHVGIGAK